MQKSDLKAGYAVVTRDGHAGIIINTGHTELSIAYLDPSYRNGWDPVNCYLDDLTWGVLPCGNDICEVFGYPGWNGALLAEHSICEHRNLLWKRKEPKKMTVAEVCEALGYDVEIVKDGDSK